ncbi:hypothetical protein ES708_02729 [subsurface metagenome]
MTTAPHIPHSQTSKAAAESLPNLNRMEWLVLGFIKDRGLHGATDDEMSGWFTTEPYYWATPTARARRVALMHKGLVVDSGKRHRTRPRGNRLGRWAVVWVLASREPELF